MKVKKLYEGSVITDDMLAQWYCEYYGLEVWKDIPGYEGYYQASTLGRIKRLERIIQSHNSTTYYNKVQPGKIIKPQVNKGSAKHLDRTRLMVCLSKDGITQRMQVHTLVMLAFVGPAPVDKPEINHKDENPLNNSIFNLEYCNGKDNCNYGTRNQRLSENHKNGKLSKPVIQYTLDGEFVKEWPSTKEIVRTMGITSISRCLKEGSTHTAKGYRWKFKQ